MAQGGFFDGLLDSIQNPLFLGGIGMMGGGVDGLQKGLLAGGQMQEQRKKQAQQQALQQGIMGMPNLTEQDKQILANSPELATHALSQMYGNKFDPMADLKRKTAEANYQQTIAENGMFPTKQKLLEAQAAKAQREAAGGGETPSNVREWQYFQTLPPEKQQQYLSMKRAEKYYDLGTSYARPDPLSPGQISGSMPKDVSGVASMKEQGEAQGKALADLPRQIDNASVALKTIDAIEKHPGKQWGVGAVGIVPGIPGTQQRGFVNLVDQAKGQVFLQAFNSLRGGGAITDAEGAKATQALSRLDRAQSQQDFDTALGDLKAIINSGLSRAKASSMARPVNIQRGGQSVDPSADGWTTLPNGVRIREKQ